DWLTVRAGAEYAFNLNSVFVNNANAVAANGTYSVFYNKIAPGPFRDKSHYIFADITFDIAGTNHIVTVGENFHDGTYEPHSIPSTGTSTTVTGFNWFNTANNDARRLIGKNFIKNYVGEGDRIISTNNIYQSFPITDQIRLGDEWMAVVGGSVNVLDITFY